MFQKLLEQALDPFSAAISELLRTLDSSWNVNSNVGYIEAKSGNKSIIISYNPLRWSMSAMLDNKILNNKSGTDLDKFKECLNDMVYLIQNVNENSPKVVYNKTPEWSHAPGFAGRYSVKAKLPVSGISDVSQINAGPGVGTV